MTQPTGTVRIGQHTVELPADEANTLFGALIQTSRLPRGGPAPITPHTVVNVTPSSDISLTITDKYANEYNELLTKQQTRLDRLAQ